MSTTIHYRGTIGSLGEIDQMREDMIRLCATLGWSYELWDEDQSKPRSAKLVHEDGMAKIEGHIPLKGISIDPHPDCEHLSFLFNPERQLSSFMLEVLKEEGDVSPEHDWVLVKTQFAPIDVHMAIVSVLRWLKDHYVPDLEVQDEGELWESGDRERLAGIRGATAGFLTRVTKALKGMPEVPGESEEELLKRMEETLEGLTKKRRE